MLSAIRSGLGSAARMSRARGQGGASGKEPASGSVRLLALVVAIFMDTVTVLFSLTITIVTVGAGAAIQTGVGAVGCVAGATAGAAGFVAGPVAGVGGVVFGCLGGIAAATFGGSVITAAIGPLGALIGIAFNICIAATFGTMLFFMLGDMGLFRPRLLIGGFGEFVPILNNLPFWTFLTLLAIVGARRKKAGPRRLLSFGLGRSQKEEEVPGRTQAPKATSGRERTPWETGEGVAGEDPSSPERERTRLVDGISTRKPEAPRQANNSSASGVPGPQAIIPKNAAA